MTSRPPFSRAGLRRAAFALLGIVVLGGLALGGLGIAQDRVPRSMDEVRLSFAPVVGTAAPAVVNIYANRLVQRSSPFVDDPFFGQFFSGRAPRGLRQENSLGSGVIVDPAGIVVSNYHVVADATEIRVVLPDRREFAGHIVLADRDADLAIIEVDSDTRLPALELADSDKAEVGDLVLAIGNPFGVGQTVTTGIVSALARSGAFGDRAGYFIQTDAAINPGNSGGALVDMSGRLLGINTSILTRSGGSNGIGFAIPSNLVRAYIEQARDGASEFLGPWAGFSGQTVTAEIAEAIGMARPSGVLVNDIHPDSSFGAAGLEVGDVIRSFAGHEVLTAADLLFRLSVGAPGETVEVGILRNGGERSLLVRLELAPDTPRNDPVVLTGASPFAGLEVAAVNPRLIQKLGLPLRAEGLLVTDVRGPALQLGLRPGDVVRAINGRPLAGLDDLELAVRAQARLWRIELLRDGRPLALALRT